MRRPSALRLAALAASLAWSCAAAATAYPNTEGFGVEFEEGEDWYRHCMRALQAVSPPPSLPAPLRPRAIRCDATDLYYLKRDQQHTSAAEWRQVRECAEESGGDAVLMMLYANGYGLARDTDRAIYHACRLDAAKAEMELRVGYLASLAAASDEHPFDLCDHITSGRMGGVCAAIGKGRDDRVRAARLERFAAGLPPGARPAFARLRAAAAAFTRASAGEVDMTGTGGPGFTFRHGGRRDEEFLDTLLKAANGALPHATAAHFAELDRELNDAYRNVLALPSEQDTHPERIRSSTVARADVRSTERAWLAYRDAWKPFLAAAHLPADFIPVKAVLTRQRIAQLKKFR